jgi:thymidylate synthase
MQSYLDLLRHILANGEQHDDRTGVGTISVFGFQWRHRLTDGFPLLTTKKVPLRWVAEELFWFLSGSTNEKDLRARGVDIWAEWATAEQCAKFGREEGDLGPVYGWLWRSYPRTKDHLPPVDQISELIRDIQQSPNSRRLIVTGWHPELQRQVALPPCHTLFQLKAHGDDDRLLSLHLYARSIDAFLGLPFNIASYALLLHLLAMATNRRPHDLVISFGDLHIYKNHLDAVNEQLAREPKPLPTVKISPRLCGGGMAAILHAGWGDIELSGYNPHPKIAAPVAV